MQSFRYVLPSAPHVGVDVVGQVHGLTQVPGILKELVVPTEGKPTGTLLLNDGRQTAGD